MNYIVANSDNSDIFTVKPYYSREDFGSVDSIGLFAQHIRIDWDYMPHTHDFNEIAIMLSGSADHVTENQSYAISRGDVLVIKGDMAHGYKNVKDLELINLMYDPHIFSQNNYELHSIPGFDTLFLIEPEIRQYNAQSSTLRLDDQALNYVEMMADFIAEQLSAGEDQKVVCRLNFMALLAFLSTQYQAYFATSGRRNTLVRALHYMEINLAGPIRLSDIAEYCFVSGRHLERLFDSAFGERPMSHLKKIRLKNALALLLEQNETVERAAVLSGFNDPGYFARSFRAEYGISPSSAKKLLKRSADKVEGD